MKVLETRFAVSHVVVFALALGGCGHAAVQPRAERPGPDLQGVYGTTTLTPSELAFGRPQAGVSAGTGVKDVDLASYLKPEALRARHSPSARIPAAAPSSATPTQKPAPEAAVAAQPAQPQIVAKVQTTKKSADFDAANYAARERNNSGLEQYRGGDAIVITASTLVIILLVVLLVVLLT